MKKLLLISLAAVLMLPLYTQSAVAGDIDRIIDQINQAIVETYGQEFKDEFREFADINKNGIKDAGEPVFNQDLFNDRGIIVYGCPRDFGPDNFDPDTGNHRFLGYTYLGEKYTNTLFRHDAFDESIPMPAGRGVQTSKVTFTQNWSIAGAPMRDVVTGRMVARVAEYPVEVRFTITYEYKYERGIRVCAAPPPGDTRIDWDTRTGTGRTTGEARGLVYVDGVGTVIIAN